MNNAILLKLKNNERVVFANELTNHNGRIAIRYYEYPTRMSRKCMNKILANTTDFNVKIKPFKTKIRPIGT